MYSGVINDGCLTDLGERCRAAAAATTAAAAADQQTTVACTMDRIAGAFSRAILLMICMKSERRRGYAGRAEVFDTNVRVFLCMCHSPPGALTILSISRNSAAGPFPTFAFVIIILVRCSRGRAQVTRMWKLKLLVGNCNVSRATNTRDKQE